MFHSSSLWSICRLSRERMSELQQQVEDLQKALQSQASKPDDVSVPGSLALKQNVIRLFRLCAGMAFMAKKNVFKCVYFSNVIFVLYLLRL